MRLLLFSAASGFSLMDMRIQEARFHTPVYHFAPPQSLLLKEPAGFASRGWVAPGEYPQEDESSYWINTKSHGNYTIEKQKRFCLSHRNSTDFIETCYIHIMSTFWWGESIRLSNKYLCTGNTCHFSIVSNTITNTKRANVSKTFAKVPLPPKPGRIYDRLASKLNMEGNVRKDAKGFFFYKPIYWATSYHVHKTVLSALNTTSRGDIQVLIYPVSKAKNLGGLFGFHTGPVGHGMKFQRPSFFEFYPNVDKPGNKSNLVLF